MGKESNEEIGVFGRRLREVRRRRGISQKQLGIQAGMDPGSASARINHYERGRHVPDYRVACLLAQQLDVSVAYLYTEDEALARIIRVYSDADDSRREKILRLMELLVD